MDPDEADAAHAGLVDAYFHPPRIVICGHEDFINGDALIVSHVELWPWRTIVRGSVTSPGSTKRNEGVPGDINRNGAWLRDWSLEDDVGTEYQPSGAGFGGDGFCNDVDVRFRTAVPAGATQLTIVAPDGRRIDVALG